MNYEAFLQGKAQSGNMDGFEPLWMPDFLFDFQKALVDWSVRKGKAAIFADCGLGKTPIQLVWGENIVRKTNKAVLILTPLAVSAQTIQEAGKFGIPAVRSSGEIKGAGIYVTNYEKLHHFDPAEVTAVVCDESSILKSFDGARRKQITEFMRRVDYRLLCTATAAPNDYIELGTSGEALGQLGYMDMLHRFFKNDNNSSVTALRSRRFQQGRVLDEQAKWRFKGHAETPFWKWVCSWARAVRRPSDLGFSDASFILPQLIERDQHVEVASRRNGALIQMPAIGLKEQREERRHTIQERCKRVADIVSDTGKTALVWCQMNDEGDLLENLISGAVQVSGKDSDEQKEEAFLAFARNEIRVLITKPKIGAWGLNFQHCSHVTFFPSHSFEQYYQGVRRCWRFGQKNPVTVDVISTAGEASVLKNLQRKAQAADKMFSALVAEMNGAIAISRNGAHFAHKAKIPSWL